ncbi:MAG: 5'-3' exonuclease H3TH domain-containing protein [bacterium]|nr:5'-3' exonuclease H3TH domain-containing protein [bacterium]
MKKLVLIDGNAILHRAYHAMPGMTNSSGQLVNAVYGFFSMFLNLLSEQKPDYLVIAFDRSKPTIRQSMYAGYHEHRPPMDGELVSQIALIDELLEKAKIKTASLEGYEGDDVIGTFAFQATCLAEQRGKKTASQNNAEDIEVVIVTGDRDMLQLVNDRAKVLMTITGLTKTALFDEKMVEEKYGVKTSQFIDYKALIGDPSDGYPGITGIGPKTAASLLQKYGTFENLYKQIDKVPEKLALKLATDAEQGALAKKLATIITDAPIRFDSALCRVQDIDMAGLRAGFSSHNFKSLIARLDGKFPQGTKAKKTPRENGQLGLL